MLTDREIDLMKAEQEKLMPETVDIERVSKGDDGFGGTSNEIWAAVASDVPARVTQAQAFDMGGQAGRNIEIEKWTVRLPVGTNCREGDRVVWGDIIIRADELKEGSYKTVLSISGERVK